MVIVVNKEDITDAQYGNLITYLEGQGMQFQRVSVPVGSNVVGLVLGRKNISICSICKGTGKVYMVRCTNDVPTSKHTCFGCKGTGQVDQLDGKKVGTDGSK